MAKQSRARSPQSTTAVPVPSQDPAASLRCGCTSKPGRVARMSGLFGGVGAVMMLRPTAGVVIVGFAVVLAALTVLPAIYGRETWSARAFQLLRLLKEPDKPAPKHPPALPR
jgi:hypothetical protein